MKKIIVPALLAAALNIMADQWDLPEKHTFDNGWRGETILNGFWQVSWQQVRGPSLPD